LRAVLQVEENNTLVGTVRKLGRGVSRQIVLRRSGHQQTPIALSASGIDRPGAGGAAESALTAIKRPTLDLRPIGRSTRPLPSSTREREPH